MLTHCEDIIWHVVDDEVLLLNTSIGYYFSFNGTATKMWCLLDQGKTIDEVAQSLADEYGRDFDETSSDVTEFVDQLRKEKLAKFGDQR